ncbi:hypothetical protein MKW92_049245, partial [Papaver armeniacum]
SQIQSELWAMRKWSSKMRKAMKEDPQFKPKRRRFSRRFSRNKQVIWSEVA